MTDAELVEKKLAFIESCVSDLRRDAALERLQTDLREQRFVLYTLQIAIQAISVTSRRSLPACSRIWPPPARVEP